MKSSEHMMGVFPWQCISFTRNNGTTLDFIVRDPTLMMVLINVIQSKIYAKPPEQDRLKFFKILRLKMKLGHLSW